MKLTVKLNLTTPKFLLGIKTLCESSPNLLDIFQDLCRHGHTVNEDHQTILAMWNVVDTIRIKESIHEIIGRNQRILNITRESMCFVDTNGIQVSWYKNNGTWVFSVLLPSKMWREEGSKVPMYQELINRGFIEEPMDTPVEHEVIK